MVVLSSVDVFLPLSMALPDLIVDFCFGESSARQIEVEQFGNVTSAKQWKFSVSLMSHLHSEQERKTGEADMMVPTFPYPHLILRHANLAFRFMKCMLDPVSLPLDPAESFP